MAVLRRGKAVSVHPVPVPEATRKLKPNFISPETFTSTKVPLGSTQQGQQGDSALADAGSMNDESLGNRASVEDKIPGQPIPTTISALPSPTKIDNGPTHPARNSNPKKRGNQWNDVSSQKRLEIKKIKTNNDPSDAELREDRKPKRKVACLIGYCGTGYHGMQLNPPNKTIEGELFDAFVKVGAVSKDNADDPKKVSFARAARTDKGVHAAVNCISLKMIVEDPDIVEQINAVLPDQIRLWRVTRTMKSFNPRTSCDSRVYEYLIPTSAFLPPPPESKFCNLSREHNGITLLQDSAARFWQEVEDRLAEFKKSPEYLSVRDDDPDVGVLALDSNVSEEDKPAAMAKLRRQKMLKQEIAKCRRGFRISEERKKSIREALSVYIGTKNFHNYTIGQTFSQPNSKRVMRSFEASEPFLIDGTEWMSLKVHGQSFMLHQIRKMVAMVLLVVRTGCPLSRMNLTFGKAKINIPKAPSLGLLLERPIFDVYNTRAGDMTADKGPIELGELDATVLEFKMKHVYDKIYAEEESESPFQTFLTSIDAYGSGGEFGYLFTDEMDTSMAQSTKPLTVDSKHQGDILIEDLEERSTMENEG